MSDLLQLPVDPSISFDNAAYKNPARLVMRTKRPRLGWIVYYCMADGRYWSLGEVTQGSQGTACVFTTRTAEDRKFGVNKALADASDGQASTAEIHAASHFYIFAVSPDGSARSRVHRFHNDAYVPRHGSSGPPWKLQGNGFPDKVNGKRGIFDRYVDLPPDYRPGDESDPPDDPAPDPGPTDPPRDPPDDSWIPEPDTRPDFADVELADQFERWRGYPDTLDAGDFKIAVHGDAAIDAEWSEHLGHLPRYESGDRFGRLCWVAWDGYGGRWVGGHGEHLRIQAGIDEGAAAGIHRWADDGLDLQETLAAKSKIDGLDRVEVEGRLGFFIVTHDQNPNPQRTPVFWTGAPFEDGQGGGDSGPDVPEPEPPPDVPDPEPEPEPPAPEPGPPTPEPEPEPPPKPRFTLAHAPAEVDAGELFRITWATEDATRVELDNSRGPIAHDLAPKGSMNARLDADETYVLRAVVSHAPPAVERVQVMVRPRRVPWWQRLLERLLR